MSGSSLDGLDVADVVFELNFDPKGELNHISWTLQHARTLPYAASWVEKLSGLGKAPLPEVLSAHAAFGRYLGDLLQPLLQTWNTQPEAVALHGHTLFHEPSKGFSFQLGDGHALAQKLGLPVIFDFRTADIALGGQGAPMSPLADKLLFTEHKAWLNLGGIANLTTVDEGRWQACDIGPANQLFNALASEMGLPYDKDGELGRRGKLLPELLEQAVDKAYYHLPPPKSLSNQWVQAEALPLFKNYAAPIEDRLHTAYRFLGLLLFMHLKKFFTSTEERRTLFITGGGAHNKFLRSCLQEAIQPLNVFLHRPSPLIVDFKEALLIALAGALRLEGLPNFLPETTGARAAAIGGNVVRAQSGRDARHCGRDARHCVSTAATPPGPKSPPPAGPGC